MVPDVFEHGIAFVDGHVDDVTIAAPAKKQSLLAGGDMRANQWKPWPR